MEIWLAEGDVQFVKSLVLSLQKSRAGNRPDLNLRRISRKQISSGKAGVRAARGSKK